jgi:ubiquinol-cytochrome c reductase cytochrome c1 subunit
VARSRGPDWLYTYLRTFYVDPSRPFGVNNAVFKDVGMPHVLWPLQGVQEPVYEESRDADGRPIKHIKEFRLIRQGSMSPEQYDKAVGDLVNFLTYMGEPGKLDRQRLGIWVLAFLALFFVVSYALKKEYWKDVH